MFKKADTFRYGLHSTVEFGLAPYRKVLEQVNRIDLRGSLDRELLELANGLRGKQADEAEVEVFALVREAARRVLGLQMFDVQMLAGAALSRGKIVEMQTGEGKTLAAVLPAAAHALSGQGVHIFTVNDYLARRDRNWMEPVYALLGLSVGCVQEGMSQEERHRAYGADITYVSAREAGFDYLRGFLCMDKSEWIQRPCHFVIVDEADSVLIDEARIPLVIAADLPGESVQEGSLTTIVRELTLGRDFAICEQSQDVSLTDAGLARVERALGCSNLYDPQHLDLLSQVNCALNAEMLLQRDRDYLIRDNKVELVDPFTGRVAEKRHWPDALQSAVRAKEGLAPETGGRIMTSVTVHNFIGLYQKMAGMTGTARAAANEFVDIYHKEVVVIPTNRPCIRIDHPHRIYCGQQEKFKAVVSEIAAAHAKGRPVLVAGGSVAESESLAAMLAEAGLPYRLLNARNDALEAEIIARAGERGAITVSTHMSGRGVDIRLGGRDERERDAVVAAGGLYVIGATFYDNVRIDNQLRGRGGRQGDPGESRFFISMEDDGIQRLDVSSMTVCREAGRSWDGEITDSAVASAIAKARRFAEGFWADSRKQLYRYSYVLEKQRKVMHDRRTEILMEQAPLRLLAERVPDALDAVCKRFGREVAEKVERELTLFFINKHWSDYLSEMDTVRESIHLVVIGNKNPLDEFHRAAGCAFAEMQLRLENDIVSAFMRADITAAGIDWEREGLIRPTATWTHLINDTPGQYSRLPELIMGIAASFREPLFSARALYRRLLKKRR